MTANWYKWLAKLPRAESRPLPYIAAQEPEINSPVLALLEMAGRKRAPATIKLNRDPLLEGSVLIADFGRRAFDEEGHRDRGERNASVYKSYRRYLGAPQ